MKAKWQWLCECLFLLLHGWRPMRWAPSSSTPKSWRWTIVWGGVELNYLRRNAWIKAKDRNHELLEIKQALYDSRHETDRCRLLLATTQQVLNMRGTDDCDILERDHMEVRLQEQIRAGLAPKKKATS